MKATIMKSKSAVFTFGRMNPPTSGHEVLIRSLLSHSKSNNAQPLVFLSKSEDSKKNPLPYSTKVQFVRKFFPEVQVVDSPLIKSPLDVYRWLSNEGYQEVYFLAGGDRVSKYQELADRNKTRFSVSELINAGDRDPDADDATGMSASKMRGFVKVGDYSAFRKGLPSKATEQDALRLYNLLSDIINEDDDSFGEY